MTPAGARLMAAEADAALARQRLQYTVTRLQARLDPKLLAHNAREAASGASQASIDTIRQNPLPAAGAATAIGLFLIRKPLARLFRRKPPEAAVPAFPIHVVDPAEADPAIPEHQA